MSAREKDQTYKIQVMRDLLAKKLTRPVVGSLVACVHCGMCNEACHYVLTHPDDPKMTPSFKADQLRKLFKYNHDWTGKVIPWWVGAKEPLSDTDLEVMKDIAFGTCTNCRRCTLNCPMGVDTATLNRVMRGLLSAVGVMPEGVRVVSKDQWEIGNQMGVLREDYLDTLEWMSDELVNEVGDETARIPIDTPGAEVMYTINPREAKYDPRTIRAAAKIFWAAGESISVIVFRYQGKCLAYRNLCVHMPRELDCEQDMIFDPTGRFLRCSMHGIVYEPMTGESVSEICTGKRLTPIGVREDEEGIWIDDRLASPLAFAE